MKSNKPCKMCERIFLLRHNEFYCKDCKKERNYKRVKEWREIVHYSGLVLDKDLEIRTHLSARGSNGILRYWYEIRECTLVDEVRILIGKYKSEIKHIDKTFQRNVIQFKRLIKNGLHTEEEGLGLTEGLKKVKNRKILDLRTAIKMGNDVYHYLKDKDERENIGIDRGTFTFIPTTNTTETKDNEEIPEEDLPKNKTTEPKHFNKKSKTNIPYYERYVKFGRDDKLVMEHPQDVIDKTIQNRVTLSKTKPNLKSIYWRWYYEGEKRNSKNRK
jgi:hypothetical protein